MIVRETISEEQAYRILSQGKSQILKKLSGKPARLQCIELIHIPFFRFKALLTGNTGNQEVLIALDGLSGSVLFPLADKLRSKKKTIQTLCPFNISPEKARQIALHEFRWTLMEFQLKHKHAKVVKEIIDMKKIFYPFWIGYFNRKGIYDFKALDAVSGQAQGIRMRKIFLQAFRQMG